MTIKQAKTISIPGEDIETALEVQNLLWGKTILLKDTDIIRIAVRRGLAMMVNEFTEKEI